MNCSLCLFLGFLLIAGIFGLQCFDCDVKDKEKCYDPINNLASSVNCEPAVKENQTWHCFTFLLQSNDSSRDGVYRGCESFAIEIENKLEYLKEQNQLAGETLSAIEVCQGDNCNKKLISSNAQNIQLTAFTLIVTFLSFLLFNNIN
ncbi:unnamed protein product [Brassicogethes aeneus]|uniref:Transmembrane protein n=1 Tax=Brassicogethes aeneus TaxID=1431903 RepID=A0A9P0FN86_BRAAE|nr:unnamed protein product [Brassicogethes aeneus]